MCDWYVLLFFVVLDLINKDFFKCARRGSVLTEKKDQFQDIMKQEQKLSQYQIF